MFPDPASRSAALFERARSVMPGGNTRHLVTFAPYTVYASHGDGCRLTDVDGNVYLDWINNFSTGIHGYGHPALTRAAADQLARMTSCILPVEAEIELAERIAARWPGIAQVRFANSGTEAAMIAVKAARALTGRPRVAKTEGGYHGQYDLLEASYLPGPANWGAADRPAAPPHAHGTPPALMDLVTVIPFNDITVSLARLEEDAADLACVIIDPIPARLGFTPARRDWLDALREFCDRTGALLVFDEIFCGRAGFHGAQGLLGVTPDMTLLGKIIGGGFPVGAVGGTRAAMAVFDDLAGPLRLAHSGTFTGNPMSMAVGAAALDALTPAAFDDLAAKGERLRAGLARSFDRLGLAMRANGLGSMTSLQFFREPIADYREFHARSGPGYLARMARLHALMLDEGVLIATRGLMLGSTPMTDADIDETLERADRALERFARAGLQEAA